MHLLIFTAVYRPFAGGYVESVHELAKRFVRKGCTVTILTCDTHHATHKEINDGVKIIRISCLNPRWLNNTFPIPLLSIFTWRLVRQALREKPDIISTQTRFFPTSWLGFIIGKIKSIPVVHTERGAVHTITHSHIINWIAMAIDHTLSWLVVRFSNATIGVSKASCQFLQHLGAKKPIKIYNGVDVGFWQKPTLTVKSQLLNVNCQKSIVITFVGRLIYAKGVQDLLRAIQLTINKLTINSQPSNVNRQMSNVTVNIIGDGTYRPALKELTHQLKLDNCVHFLGEMTKEGVRKILWQTDIFVNPSHSEGLPRSVLEAAAVGLPIVATDVGGTKEIIPTADYGILIPPNNPNAIAVAISLLINNNELRAKLGRNIQIYVKEHFDWDKITEQYLEVFERLTVNNLHLTIDN